MKYMDNFYTIVHLCKIPKNMSTSLQKILSIWFLLSKLILILFENKKISVLGYFIDGADYAVDCKPFQNLMNSIIDKQYIIWKFFDMLQNEMKTNKKLFDEITTTNLILGRIPIQYIMNK